MPTVIRAGFMGLCLLWMMSVVAAQSEAIIHDVDGGTQEYTGIINDADNDEILVYLDNLTAGDTIYAMAIGLDAVDPFLIVTDSKGTTTLVEDNNGGGGVNAAITFQVEADGNYVLGMISVDGIGAYRLMIGINDPRAVALRPIETIGAAIGNNIRDTFIGVHGEVRRFTGVFQNHDDTILVVFLNLEAGDEIFIYAAGLGFVDPFIEIMNQSLSEAFADDNDSGGGYNAFVSYKVQVAGSYTARITTLGQIGNYEITAGVNTPEIRQSVDAPTGFAAAGVGFNCDAINRLGSRPNLTGFDRSRQGETYIIHYTLDGEDATTEVYVDVMEEALGRSLDVQFNDLGWAVPPADCGEGGDSRLDVYVIDLGTTPAIGIAVPEAVIGDNPATEREEFFATYSYLLVENDMDFLSSGHFALDLMRATVAHEVHHNIQFGYDFNDSYHGFYEAGATWIETLVYPTANTVSAYVEDVFDMPDVCMGHESDDDLREYGEWLMIDSFTRDFGVESYQFIWEVIGTRQGLPGFYAALQALGTTPQEVIERMAIRNLLLDYALAKRFTTTVHIENRITRTGFIRPERDGVQELSVDYVSIRAKGRYTIDIADSNKGLTMLVVGIDMDSEVARVFDIGRRGTVDTSQFDYAYLIILNPNVHVDTNACQYVDWTIRIFDGANDTLTTADDEVWNASEFVPVR